jgi:hypothetical protein
VQKASLNSLILGDTADKDFPDIGFTLNTTNNIALAGYPGYLSFRDPASDALQRFTNIGAIIGDKACIAFV